MSIPTREEELLAVALRIERNYELHGAAHLAQMLGAAALQQDHVQISFWKAVIAQYDRLSLRKGEAANH
jgi:hypothetical protein